VNEVIKFLNRLVRNMMESTRPFVRWMHGSCVETPEQLLNPDDDDPYVFTYYTDISAHPSVMKLLLSLFHTIQRTITGVNRFTDHWRKHQHLWKRDKNAELDKFSARIPSCRDFEEKLARYTKMAVDFWALPKNKDMDFVRISAHSLIGAVRDEANEWVTAIARVMNELDRAKLAELQDYMQGLDTGLHADPNTLEELKGVLHNISQVRSGFFVLSSIADG
jgi:dynein heavy chain